MSTDIVDAVLWLRVAALERDKAAPVPYPGKRHVAEFLSRLSFGNDLGEVSAVYSATLTAATNVDLIGGLTSLADGQAVDFPKVTTIIAINRSLVTGEGWLVGGGTDGLGASALLNWVTGAAHRRRVGPGGLLVAHSPIDAYEATDTTADVLRFEPEAGAPSLDLLILGRT